MFWVLKGEKQNQGVNELFPKEKINEKKEKTSNLLFVFLSFSGFWLAYCFKSVLYFSHSFAQFRPKERCLFSIILKELSEIYIFIHFILLI